ncbi:MAG: hypothetical protein K2X47_13085 [Bdellovibrionales bacterium]|nr:hypothetical protein [Bdellovibrionales bacterium]
MRTLFRILNFSDPKEAAEKLDCASPLFRGIVLRAAKECSEDEFVEFLVTKALPPIRLSGLELEAISGERKPWFKQTLHDIVVLHLLTKKTSKAYAQLCAKMAQTRRGAAGDAA